MMNGGMNCMMGGGIMMFGMVFSFFLLFGLIIAAGVGLLWLVRQTGQARSPSPTEAPGEILKRRYAQGEITAEQFEGMKRQLNL